MTENNDNMSFADMLDDNLKMPGRFEPGEQVVAKVVRITGNSVFLDIGGKSEGCIDRNELLDKEGNLTVNEGDVVKAFFLSAQRNEMLFTTNLGSGPGAKAHLEDAFNSKIPVEGKVVKEIKGGYEIKIAGSVRAFCPYSQMGLKRVEDPEEYIDQELKFIINQFTESGRNIVLSRRILLEQEREERKEEIRETLKVGDTVQGEITSIRDFGAFIDIGGIEGLIPISEMGWGRVEDIHGILAVAQKVEVVVMKLDWDNDRYSFSLKGTLADPWDNAVVKYTPGSAHVGKVVRLMNFGAFVTLEDGIDGLVHISNLGGGRRINHPREVVGEGQSLEVIIESVDPDAKRIALTVAAAVEADNDARQEQAETRKIMAEKSAEAASSSMGTFADLLQKKMAK